MTTANGESRGVLCPYCGHLQTAADHCHECGGLFEPLSRRATQIAMGPWYIRDARMPYRPGCSYDVIQRQAKAGKLKPTTVLRGPTTRQFWSLARNVPGIAHLLGYCHECGAKVSPESPTCPSCGVEFPRPTERNELGLMYKTHGEATRAQKHLDRAVAEATGKPVPERDPEDEKAGAPGAGAPGAPGADLLDDVLGDAAGGTGKPGSAEPVGAGATGPTLRDKAATSIAPLDFAPSDSDDDAELAPATATASAAGARPYDLDELNERNNRLGTMTWLLVGVNVVILIVVGYMFIMLYNRSKQEKPAPENQPPPAQSDTTRVPDGLDLFEPITPTAPPNVTTGGSTLATASPTEPGDPVVPADPPTTATAQPADPDAAQKAADARLRAQEHRMRVEAINAEIHRAQDLYNRGELASAKAVLIALREEPSRYRPQNLEQWIEHIDRSAKGELPTGGTFFTIPTDR